MKYFEVSFDGDTTSMCIIGERSPTIEEATEFLSKDMSILGVSKIDWVHEIPKEEAYCAFDMADEESFPVFGKIIKE